MNDHCQRVQTPAGDTRLVPRTDKVCKEMGKRTQVKNNAQGEGGYLCAVIH